MFSRSPLNSRLFCIVFGRIESSVHDDYTYGSESDDGEKCRTPTTADVLIERAASFLGSKYKELESVLCSAALDTCLAVSAKIARSGDRLSSKVMCAGCILHSLKSIVTTRRIYTKDICRACEVTAPTARKAGYIFERILKESP